MPFDLAFQLQLLFGAVVVAVYSYQRFNVPSTNRASTTALRYHISAGLYFLTALTLYMFLAFSPDLALFLAEQLGGETAYAVEYAGALPTIRELSPPLLALILITMIFPVVPGISHADLRIRRNFQRMARIPYEVRRLSKRLREADFEPPDELRERLDSHLAASGFSRPEAPGDAECWQAWRRLTAMVLELREWRTRWTYETFVDDYGAEYEAILKSYEAKTPIALEYFGVSSLLARVGRAHAPQGAAPKDAVPQDAVPQDAAPQDAAPHNAAVRDAADAGGPPDFEEVQTLVRNYRQGFLEQCNDMLARTCDFVARGVLKCHQTRRGRIRAIHRLGLRPRFATRPSADQIVMVYLLMVVVLALVFIFSGTADPQAGQAAGGSAEASAEDFRPPVALVFLVPVIHCLAVLWAVYPKDVWEIARREENGVRPYRFYLLAGGLASLTALPVMLVLWSLHYHDIQQALDWIADRWAIALLPLGTAMFTAFNLDNPHRPGMRWIEGLGQGAAQATLAFTLFRFGLFPTSPEASALPPLLGVPLPPLIVSFAIGSIIGTTVPHMYRAAARRERKERECEERAAGESAATAQPAEAPHPAPHPAPRPAPQPSGRADPPTAAAPGIGPAPA